jgi:hypothetical protein
MNSPVAVLTPITENAATLTLVTEDYGAVTPVVENGFTLVEEDDVAFSLSICREINRIYGTYQEGDLPHSDPMRAGLVLTMEMFATLKKTVHDGMPAMRIEVAQAQAREMMATMFGLLSPSRRPRSLTHGRERHPVAARTPAIAPVRNVVPQVGRTGWPYDQLKELAERSAVAAPGTGEGDEVQTPPSAASPQSVVIRTPGNEAAPSRQRSVVRPRSLVARVLLTLLRCCLAAVLIDAPFALVASFPSLLLPSLAALVGACATAVWYRVLRRRTAKT